MTVPPPNAIDHRHDGHVHRTWETCRQPDAVRAAALANAVELFGVVAPRVDAVLQSSAHAVDIVVDMAQAFEAYLTGEEAHDTTHP